MNTHEKATKDMTVKGNESEKQEEMEAVDKKPKNLEEGDKDATGTTKHHQMGKMNKGNTKSSKLEMRKIWEAIREMEKVDWEKEDEESESEESESEEDEESRQINKKIKELGNENRIKAVEIDHRIRELLSSISALDDNTKKKTAAKKDCLDKEGSLCKALDKLEQTNEEEWCADKEKLLDRHEPTKEKESCADKEGSPKKVLDKEEEDGECSGVGIKPVGCRYVGKLIRDVKSLTLILRLRHYLGFCRRWKFKGCGMLMGRLGKE